MKNRHLCRGKRTDNGEWAVGYFYEFMGKPYIFESPFTSKNLTYEVDPSTICQCTGLQDKNGRLIWEKDILMAYLDEDHPEDVTYAKVEWNGFGWILQENNSEDQEYLDDFVMENYEVCGNTIDNPELLEV